MVSVITADFERLVLIVEIVYKKEKLDKKVFKIGKSCCRVDQEDMRAYSSHRRRYKLCR